MKSLRIATCQFSVEADIAHNRRWILKQIAEAADDGADLVHFSEMRSVRLCRRRHSRHRGPRLGSLDLGHAAISRRPPGTARSGCCSARRIAFPLATSRTTASMSSIAQGKIADRYDKRFCTGVNAKRQPTLDLAHYSPGNRFVTFRVKGVTCGVLICYDYRFPELYRHYRKLGVQHPPAIVP